MSFQMYKVAISTFQIEEIKQANVNAILRALEYPSADMDAVLHNLSAQYDSTYKNLSNLLC